MKYLHHLQTILLASLMSASLTVQAAELKPYIAPKGVEFVDISNISKKIASSKGRVLVHITAYDTGCPSKCSSFAEQNFVEFSQRNKGKLKIWVTRGEYDLSVRGQQFVKVKGPFAKMTGLDENNSYSPPINYLFIDGKLEKNIPGKILADGLEKAVFTSK